MEPSGPLLSTLAAYLLQQVHDAFIGAEVNLSAANITTKDIKSVSLNISSGEQLVLIHILWPFRNLNTLLYKKF